MVNMPSSNPFDYVCDKCDRRAVLLSIPHDQIECAQGHTRLKDRISLCDYHAWHDHEYRYKNKHLTRYCFNLMKEIPAGEHCRCEDCNEYVSRMLEIEKQEI